VTRKPTVEWQVCGVCNYDCSYCIQSKKYRVGHPSEADICGFLDFFSALPGRWEIKMTGGEPFSFRGFVQRIVPGLVQRTPHLLSVLTNLSAPLSVLEHFAIETRGRLGIVSASLHLEHVDVPSFVEKARRFRALIDPNARLVINTVLVPGRLDRVEAAREALEDAGLTCFPQVMKTKTGVFDYDSGDKVRLRTLVGDAPTPRSANVAPSYRGLSCWAGTAYFVLTQTGDAWSCRTAKRFSQGRLGNVLDGSFALGTGPVVCTYDICPCTVPANRGMIEGVSP
jgi:hypothetical protein